MRTTLLLLALAPAALDVNAQTVLQDADIPSGTTTFNAHYATDIGTSSLDAVGNNAHWTFAPTSPIEAPNTITLGPSSATPYTTTYPTSNLAQATILPTGTQYSYMLHTADGLYLLADQVDPNGARAYTQPRTLLSLPLSLNGSFQDNYAYNGNTYSTTRTYNGFGSLTAFGSTYENVARIETSGGNVDFYTTNPIRPLLHYEQGGITVLLVPITTGIQEQAAAPLRAYPNPVADHLTVDDVKPGSTWQVLDATGRIVSRGNSSTNGNLRIPMASLTPGTYVLVVNGSGVLRRATVVKD